MAFTIPNNTQSGVTANPQSLWMETDIGTLVQAFTGVGVISGCAVTAQASPDMTVAVASGVATTNATSYLTVTAGNVTATTSDPSLPRIDLVYVNSSGTKSIATGTPASAPAMPALPANSVPIAALYVAPAATVISSSRITDKRVVVKQIVPDSGTTGQLLVAVTGAPGVWTSSPTIPGNLAVTGTLAITGTGAYTGGQRAAIATLSDGATITPDFALGNNFSVTLGDNRTLANPTNLVAGQSGSIFITQDGTGSRTLAYGSFWDFVGGTAPTLSTPASTVDRLDYIVRTTGSIHAVLSKAWS